MTKICIDKNSAFLILLTVFIGIGYFLFFTLRVSIPNIIINSKQPSNNVTTGDLLKQFDYGKIYDPLEGPTKRVDRSLISSKDVKQLFDVSTRGNPDNYQQMGILISNDNNDSNKIIKLFGRKEYPNSDIYQYYALVNNGNDNIKIPLTKQKKEIFDKDSIFVEGINKNYIATIYENNSPRYNPDIID